MSNILIDDKSAVSTLQVEIKSGVKEYKFADQYLFKEKNVLGIYASSEFINDADIDSLQNKARLTLLVEQKTVIDKMKLVDLRLSPTYFQLKLGKILFEKSVITLDTDPTPTEVGKTLTLIVVYER